MNYNNGNLYYELTGLGDPIIFIHGFSLDHTMWYPQIEFFRRNYQVIAYDVRGFGRSSVPERPYDHAADLHALLDYLGIKQTHIVGLSMGGRIAVNFALAYPKMIKKLVLMDTALDGYPSEVDWNVRAKEEGIENAKKNWLDHELFSAAQKQPEVVTVLRSMIESYSGWHWLHSDLQEPANTHARDRLSQIDVPTLILVGENDLSYFHSIANVLAAGIPGAQKTIVPDTGHMVNMEASDTVNNLLSEFIAKS